MHRNTDEYNAELERMNMQMSAENLALQNDNKQLNALIKEYEQTLENLMTTFRNRAVRRLLAFYDSDSDPTLEHCTERGTTT